MCPSSFFAFANDYFTLRSRFLSGFPLDENPLLWYDKENELVGFCRFRRREVRF